MKQFALIALLLLTADCGGDPSWSGRTLVVGGKYEYMKCDQLAASIKATQAKIDELNGLSAKAVGAAGGNVIGAAVYGPPLTEAKGNLVSYKETYAAKKCAQAPQ